jgi:DNA-binding transcriptional regulator YiaG
MTIKETRVSAGLSRAEMSRQFEIPVRTLEDWENGKRTPPVWAEKLILEKLESIKQSRGE